MNVYKLFQAFAILFHDLNKTFTRDFYIVIPDVCVCESDTGFFLPFPAAFSMENDASAFRQHTPCSPQNWGQEPII
jgi:hypothetical protein